MSGRSPCHLAALFAVVGLLSGCSSSPMLPAAPTIPNPIRSPYDDALATVETRQRGDFYPLRSGNRWHYQRRFTVRTVDAGGSELGREDFFSELERVQTCIEHEDGRDYLVERSEETSPNAPFRRWVRFRQESGGLFEADNTGPPACETGASFGPTNPMAFEDEVCRRAVERVADQRTRAAFDHAWATLRVRLQSLREAGGSIEPLRHQRGPGRGPGRPPEGELLRLRYPLHPGQRWIIRDHPFRSEAMVERAEILRLAPGRMFSWRIRYTGEFLDPQDQVHVWYGPQGFLKLALRIETVAIDKNGNPVGKLISEELLVLDELDLVDRRR